MNLRANFLCSFKYLGWIRNLGKLYFKLVAIFKQLIWASTWIFLNTFILPWVTFSHFEIGESSISSDIPMHSSRKSYQFNELPRVNLFHNFSWTPFWWNNGSLSPLRGCHDNTLIENQWNCTLTGNVGFLLVNSLK
jgi:hypothetical protein